ncbi:hypothetical protein BS17DRAFT_818180 [Gyrodon lividus]|nr:hypothetical protein BS17DRAFT_818180 [Gyrodon lividus]
MDAIAANLVLNATTKTITNILWGEVQGGEWDIVVERMENAMCAAHAIIQHANVIPGIVIAVEQLLHPQDTQWPHWMAMIEWMHESVSRHEWAQHGRVQLEEVLGMEEEETWGEEILQMKMEEDEEDKVYTSRRKEHVKGKRRADATDGETSLGKSKADEVGR